EAGAIPIPLGVADDEPESLRRVLADGLAQVDAVITTGGVSAGAYDVVKEVLEPLGDVAFTAVAMQPGKPQGFGVLTAPAGRAGTAPPRPSRGGRASGRAAASSPPRTAARSPSSACPGPPCPSTSASPSSSAPRSPGWPARATRNGPSRPSPPWAGAARPG